MATSAGFGQTCHRAPSQLSAGDSRRWRRYEVRATLIQPWGGSSHSTFTAEFGVFPHQAHRHRMTWAGAAIAKGSMHARAITGHSSDLGRAVGGRRALGRPAKARMDVVPTPAMGLGCGRRSGPRVANSRGLWVASRSRCAQCLASSAPIAAFGRGQAPMLGSVVRRPPRPHGGCGTEVAPGRGRGGRRTARPRIDLRGPAPRIGSRPLSSLHIAPQRWRVFPSEPHPRGV